MDNNPEILDKLEQRIERLENRRLLQQDIMPQVINPRHLNVNVDGWSFPNGIILTDTVTGTLYRIKVTSGTLGIEAY